MANQQVNPAPHLSAIRQTVYYWGEQFADCLVTKKEPGWVHWTTSAGDKKITPDFATVAFDRPPCSACMDEGANPCKKHAPIVASEMLNRAGHHSVGGDGASMIPACVEQLLPKQPIQEDDIVDGEMVSPIIGGPPVKFRGLVTSISGDSQIAIVKIAKPYDCCTCYLSRITAQVFKLTKASDQNAAALRAALATEA